MLRYFKYKNINVNYNNALKEQYKILTGDKKRTFRKEERWRKLGTIVTYLVVISCAAIGVFLLKLIPLPSAWFLKVFVIVFEVAFCVAWLIACGKLTIRITKPFWKKAESFHIPTMQREIFSKACKHLRDYYELHDPYIITKCFDATDKTFRNHDVCIFVVCGELRITADLVRGFLHGQRDLGCYAFRREEITLSKQKSGNHLIVELRANNTLFLLGYRAKGFIEKNFLEWAEK